MRKHRPLTGDEKLAAKVGTVVLIALALVIFLACMAVWS